MFARSSPIHILQLACVLSVALIALSCDKPSNYQANDRKTSAQNALNQSGKVSETVIYGADDRHDLYDEKDAAVRAVADSTVALIKTSELTPREDGTVDVLTTTFGNAYRLCPDERFRDQDTAPFCSGFLIAPDLVVSAGHCVGNAVDCSEVSFVFGFSLPTPNASVKNVPAADVYSCREIIHTQAPAKGADFSILRLDRPVTGHTPLKLRSSGTIAAAEDVFVVGYPSGLPLKIAGGAKVRNPAPDGYFVANLDTYGGNSGSAVFNAHTLEVEGVLVRGERDFILEPQSCMASNHCPDDGCRGEDVTKITDVEKYLTRSLAH